MADVSVAGFPFLYQSGVRYQRDAGDFWSRPRRSRRRRRLDCEDASAWRVAELAVSGVDPRAEVWIVPSGPRQAHAVVARDGGRWTEDPSRVLGMARGKRGLRVRFKRGQGYTVAGVDVPLLTGDVLTVEDAGVSSFDALANALDLLPGAADSAGVSPGWSYGLDSYALDLDDLGFAELLSGAAVDAAVPLVTQAVEAIKGFILGEDYDAARDFFRNVANSDAQVARQRGTVRGI